MQYLRTPRAVELLAVDSTSQNFPRRVIASVFTTVPVQPLRDPTRVVAVSLPALRLISSNAEALVKDSEFAKVYSGGSVSGWGHCYWGTQFGNYAGQLGDGAAMLIGESTETGFELNLKGSGKTTFSRGFDGRKVTRSSVREFLCSEFMAGAGVPTTRAGSIILSETSKVMRDVNYSGRPIEENCAVISRIAKTFFRFGSFESDALEDSQSIKALTKYCWEHLVKPLAKNPAESFMDVVIDRTAETVALWQALGFTHGVMNTDNMSIIGDTIDYGPFGFVETYDPHFVPNTSDKFGRYAFSEQPRMAAWNLQRFSDSIALHVGETEAHECGWKRLEGIESQFFARFRHFYDRQMRMKLGLIAAPENDFIRIRDQILELMDFSAVDFTVTFRALSDLTPDSVETVLDRIMTTFTPPERVVRLASANLRVSRQDIPEIEEFARSRPQDLERAGISRHAVVHWKHKLDRIDRFSGEEAQVCEEAKGRWKLVLNDLATYLDHDSRAIMKTVNPVYIPRQALIQMAIEKLEANGDPSEVEKLLAMFLEPYKETPGCEEYEKPDLTNFGVTLSCSS